MLKIAVCVKQVPHRSEGGMDKETGVIIRSGLKSVMNVYDFYAIETALQIKEGRDCSVHVFTMGPLSAEAVVRDAYAMGVDEGYLISDRIFQGADVLATSYTLMQGITSTDNYDLILCGKQTTDGDTAQVGGSLAQWMRIPYISMVSGLVEVREECITVKQLMDHEELRVLIPYPCLLSVERDIYTPRMPSLKLKMQSRKKEVHILDRNSLLDQQLEHYGHAGSATKVVKIYPSKGTAHNNLIRMGSTDAAEAIFRVVEEVGFIGK